jgi:hypothetical protein
MRCRLCTTGEKRSTAARAANTIDQSETALPVMVYTSDSERTRAIKKRASAENEAIK